MTAQLIQFPKAKKRGPKTRTGPCAQVVAFPVGQSIPAWKKWLWLSQRGEDWSVDEMGDPDEVVPASARDGEQARRMGEVLQERVRYELPGLEARLQKRSTVKGWLEGLGVDWQRVQTAEDALFFAFDRLSGPIPPSAA